MGYINYSNDSSSLDVLLVRDLPFGSYWFFIRASDHPETQSLKYDIIRPRNINDFCSVCYSWVSARVICSDS